MTQLSAYAERHIGVAPDVVYRCIADYKVHHPNILPAVVKDFKLVEGGVGSGTVFTFHTDTVRGTREFRMSVNEPAPGSVLTESDTEAGMFTTFTIIPEGDGCKVRIETSWEAATGITGMFEKFLAPTFMQRAYTDQLSRLDEYARTQV